MSTPEIPAETTHFEVSPEELIDVAKHLWREKMSHREAVEHAYKIIFEAHLMSAGIRHSNQAHHPSPESISELVWQSERNVHGQPLRLPLLVAFIKSLEMGANPSNVSKRFNEWIRESLRKESFLAVMPWNAAAPGIDLELHQRLCDNGWIQWYDDDRGQHHLITPSSRKEPTKKPRKKPAAGEHKTAPYWETRDVWWPDPEDAEIEKRKSEYLTPGRDAFIGTLAAEQALERFKGWLELEEKLKKVPAKKQQPKNAGGVFVSPKDKGAGRGDKGRFGRARKKS